MPRRPIFQWPVESTRPPGNWSGRFWCTSPAKNKRREARCARLGADTCIAGRQGGARWMTPQARHGTTEQIATSAWLCYRLTALACNCISDVSARLHLSRFRLPENTALEMSICSVPFLVVTSQTTRLATYFLSKLYAASGFVYSAAGLNKINSKNDI